MSFYFNIANDILKFSMKKLNSNHNKMWTMKNPFLISSFQYSNCFHFFVSSTSSFGTSSMGKGSSFSSRRNFASTFSASSLALCFAAVWCFLKKRKRTFFHDVFDRKTWIWLSDVTVNWEDVWCPNQISLKTHARACSSVPLSEMCSLRLSWNVQIISVFTRLYMVNLMEVGCRWKTKILLSIAFQH